MVQYQEEENINLCQYQKPNIIKGLSWMISVQKPFTQNHTRNSTTIDENFKIFTLKGQKKKWKKKTCNKFQQVKDQIEALIRTKYEEKDTFTKNYKKQIDLNHTPHLLQIKNRNIYQTKTIATKNKENIKSQEDYRMNDYQLRKNKKEPTYFDNRLSECINNNPQSDQKQFKEKYRILTLQNNESKKIDQSRKILNLHKLQMSQIQKENDSFFSRKEKWITDKAKFYSLFSIKQYQNFLVEAQCNSDQQNIKIQKINTLNF